MAFLSRRIYVKVPREEIAGMANYSNLSRRLVEDAGLDVLTLGKVNVRLHMREGPEQPLGPFTVHLARFALWVVVRIIVSK